MSSALNTYHHHIPIQIRFNDVDRLNHVNNACYLSFFELGRVCYFNDVFKNIIDWNKSGFVLARTEIDHLLPVYLNDQVTCYTKVTNLGNKSLNIENALTKYIDGQEIICAQGIGVLVAFDYKENCSIEIPQIWRERILMHEKDLLA